MAFVRDKSGNDRETYRDTNYSYSKNVGPPTDGIDYTPSDTAYITDSAGNQRQCRMIGVETAGDIAFEKPSGLQGVMAFGEGLTPFEAAKIRATGTTATGIRVYF